jgi:hypothetical protein
MGWLIKYMSCKKDNKVINVANENSGVESARYFSLAGRPWGAQRL